MEVKRKTFYKEQVTNGVWYYHICEEDEDRETTTQLARWRLLGTLPK
jgi:hypothetical protein